VFSQFKNRGFLQNDGKSVENRARLRTMSFRRAPMDAKVLGGVIEERLSEESARRDKAAAMRTLLELV
jgi:hypothetical protein